MGKRQIHIEFLALLLLILFCDDALGQQRGLFLLDNLRQSVEFSYQYDGRDNSSENNSENSSGLSSHQQRFEEIYRFGINYAIYDPRLLKGRFTADAILTQETFSDSSNSGSGYGSDYEYSLDGTLFERKLIPMVFFSRSGTSRVQRLFSQGYDLRSDSNGAAIAVNNRYLPAQFSYSRVTSETSGLLQDRHQKTEYYLFTLANTFRQLSRTDVAMSRFTDNSWIKGDGGEINSTNDDFTFTNNLTWEKEGKRRGLYTLYRFDKDTGDRKQQLSYLQESLIWDLGKALRTGFDYSFSHRRITGLSETENLGYTWLEHRLFQSLTTRLSFKAREKELSTGREMFTSGALDLVYRKKLPDHNLLQLEFAQAIDITDRNLKDARLTAPDETFTASFFIPYRLLHPGVLADTVVLRSATPSSLHFNVPFVPGLDYSIVEMGAFSEIRILPGGDITDGVDSLVVSYQYQDNPDIKFATYYRRIGGSFFLDSRYRFYGSVDQSNQELLSGRADLLQLNDLNIYRIGIESNRERHTVAGEYVNYDSTMDKHQSVEASWRYVHTYNNYSLTLRLSDRYTRFESIPSAPGSIRHWENLFSGSAVYRRPLSSFALLRIKTDYAKASGERISRDDIAIGTSLQMRINKFTLTLATLVSWQRTDTRLMRNDLIHLELVRFF